MQVLCLQPWYDALAGYHFSLPEDDARQKFIGESWHVKINSLAEETMLTLQGDEDKQKREMIEEQEGFRKSLTDISNAVDGFEQFTDISNVDYVNHEAQTVHKKLREAEQQAQLYNSREVLLGIDPTDYGCLKKISETFEPFVNFWQTVSSWKVGRCQYHTFEVIRYIAG